MGILVDASTPPAVSNTTGAALSSASFDPPAGSLIIAIAVVSGDQGTIADSLTGALPARAAWPLAASQEDLTAIVGAISVPVMIMSGAEDRVDPPATLRRELLARIAHAQFHELAHVGHLLPYEAPDAVAGLLGPFVHALG